MTERKTMAQVYWEIEDQFKAALKRHGSIQGCLETTWISQERP